MAHVTKFKGYSEKGLRFLVELAANNNREWFEANKIVYQDHVLAPSQALVLALGERLKEISNDIQYDTRTNGSGSLMRIYRDVRFSRDKTPYNTHITMGFWEGPRKKMENPSFGLRIGVEGTGLYAGQFHFPKDVLPVFRETVASETEGSALANAIQAIQHGGRYELHGAHYKRVPRGYGPDHPRADLLRHNGLYLIYSDIDPAVLLSPELVDVCMEHFRQMAPVQRWLVNLNNSVA